MAEPVANLPISNSYVGLLRISNDTTGVSGTPVSVYTSDGKLTALSLGDSSATVTGGLTVKGSIKTDAITTDLLGVNAETLFGNTITFSKASDDTPGVINEAGVIFENRGTFKSTGTINSEGTANFTTLSCSGDAIFNGDISLGGSNLKNGVLTVASNEITVRGDKFTVAAININFSNAVTFNSSVNLGANATAVTPPTGDSTDKIATTAFVKAVTSAGLPAGTIQIYAGETAPAGYLLCQGQEISKSIYKELFAAIRYIYGGSGDKFNVPDLRGVFLRGNDAGRGIDSGRKLGTQQQSGAPNIKGTISVYTTHHSTGHLSGQNSADGAFSVSEINGEGESYNINGRRPQFAFDASRSSSVYQNGLTEVRPVNVAINYIIKY